MRTVDGLDTLIIFPGEGELAPPIGPQRNDWWTRMAREEGVVIPIDAQLEAVAVAMGERGEEGQGRGEEQEGPDLWLHSRVHGTTSLLMPLTDGGAASGSGGEGAPP